MGLITDYFEKELNCPDITNIRVLSFDDVRIKLSTPKQMRHSIRKFFSDAEDYNRFIGDILSQNGKNPADKMLVYNFFDTSSVPGYNLKISIASPTVNVNRAYLLHIRKIPKV